MTPFSIVLSCVHGIRTMPIFFLLRKEKLSTSVLNEKDC